jgi:quinol monooxygenase YgiN
MILVMIGAATLPDKRTEFTQTVVSLLGQIRASQGCLSCDIYHKFDDENAFCLCEEWSSPEEFESHSRTDSFAILRGAMQILLREPPEIKIYVVARILEDFAFTAN